MHSFHSSSEALDCPICKELRGDRSSRLAIALDLRGVRSAVGPATENFTTIPSLGPLTLGHSLIVPRIHTHSVLLHAAAKDLDRELAQIIVLNYERLARVLGDTVYLLFEHTSMGAENALCSTSHAHLHVVPIPRSSATRVEQRLRAEAGQFSLDELAVKCATMTDFIYARLLDRGTPSATSFLLGSTKRPSQYMRQVAAEALGSPSWDWKVDPASKLLIGTMKLFFSVETQGGALAA